MSGPPPFQLTYTKLETFDQCRRLYWFRYVCLEPWPEPVTTPALAVGSAVHRALKTLADSNDDEAARQDLDAYLRMPKHECAAPGTRAYDDAMSLLEAGIAAHRAIESAACWAEVDTWAAFPSREMTLRARADRVDRLADGSYQVIDWKTGNFDLADKTDRQLDIAHVAVRATRRLEREAEVVAVAWNLRTGGRRIRILGRGHAMGTMRYVAGAADRIRQTTEFPATPGPFCRFCDWRDRCPEAEAVVSGAWTREYIDWEREDVAPGADS